MAPKCGLENTIKKIQRKTRLSTNPETRKIFDYLDSQLTDLGLEGTVQTLLVYDAHGKINCYGHRIEPDTIFGRLNLTIGTEGTRLTGKVSYPEPHHNASYQKGYFVPGEEFKELKGTYLALVNIPFNPEELSIVAYPLTPKSYLFLTQTLLIQP